jgi:hypothetical protein
MLISLSISGTTGFPPHREVSHKLNDNVESTTKGLGRVYRLQERFEESETQLRMLLDAVK